MLRQAQAGRGFEAPMMGYETGSATDVGMVRTRNEDNYFADPAVGLWLVSDGMGGHDAGDLASAAVVDAVRTIGKVASAEDLQSRVQDRLIVAHNRMRTLARERRSDMVGATVAVLLTFDNYFACLWSGDSRLYRVRGTAIDQISRDHNEVEDMVDRGILTRAEANAWSGRNALTRAVGVFDNLELEIVRGSIEPGDIFVLCSDGLTIYASDGEIRDAVTRLDPQPAADHLVALAKQRGGEDNVTVVVVRCMPQSEGDTTVIRPRGAMHVR